ncbi:MAG TPA: hypothetical protein VJB65_03355, partial [Patescibacteria group bacterium]|nr:hypothetical protein [Patescibacteria group bacterium]
HHFSTVCTKFRTDSLDNWGCADSKYLLGNFNGDSKNYLDLAQVRFDTADIGRIYVATSNGTKFISTGEWKADFGDEDYFYFAHDVNSDKKADIMAYYDDGSNDKNDHIYLSTSTGSAFNSKTTLLTGVDRESGGQFLFGNFGNIYLLTGYEEFEECE